MRSDLAAIKCLLCMSAVAMCYHLGMPALILQAWPELLPES